MKPNRAFGACSMFLLLLACAAAPGVAMAADVTVRIRADQPGPQLSPHLYGLFFEDINFAADGGLYAELVQNRSFEYFPCVGWNPRSEAYHPLYAWEKVERDGGSGRLRVERGIPLNRDNENYLSLLIEQPGAGVGVRNLGFDGIRIDDGEKYRVSFYARWSHHQRGTVTVTLETPEGDELAKHDFEVAGNDWKKYEAEVAAEGTADAAQLVLASRERGALCLDMISLFPKATFNGRENGLRADLVQALADLKPGFLRFPGGCIAHGHSLQNAYRWKDTVGDVAERRPNWNRWGYHQTYGLGFYEYFLLSEDIGAKPLPVLPVGVSCGFNEPYQCVPMDELQPWIDDVLDLIEFANGPADSRWGRVRAEMGHPEPFGLEFVCLGNEEHDTPELHERFPDFVAAVREKHPEIKIIGTSGLSPSIPLYPLMRNLRVFSTDEHYYENPEWFVRHQNRFDDFSRQGPKIFVGEYASRGNAQRNAVSEAAYLTGIERNGDLIDMACYAPLFAHVDHTQWRDANLIWFDKRRVMKTPNYYVQQLFSQNKGDVALACEVQQDLAHQQPLARAAVGVGTWATAIAVDKASVNDRLLPPEQWQAKQGDFSVAEGQYEQRDERAQPAMAVSEKEFEDEKIVYRVRCKKTAGREGMLVIFDYQDENNYAWWNVGGWGNTAHGLERRSGGQMAILARTPGRVETGRWYDLRVERTPGRIRCFLDDRLVNDYADVEPGASAIATRDSQSGQLLVKLVNPTDRDLDVAVELAAVGQIASEASVTTLAAEPGAVNTIDDPEKVAPAESTIAVGETFSTRLPAWSVQFVRIDAKE